VKIHMKTGVVFVLLAVVAAVVIAKSQRKVPPPPAMASSAGLPRLVDLGAHSCIPCKKMAPILEELRSEYQGRLQVDFIDVWQNPDAGQPYGIRLIPTQIFYDASGKELARHEGFLSKEDIVAQFEARGVPLPGPKE